MTSKPVDGYVRDSSGAVINTDNGALQAYKLKKNRDKEIDNLKYELSEIKQMLTALLSKTT